MVSEPQAREGAAAPAPSVAERLAHLIGGTVTLLALAWAGDVPRALGLVLYTEQFLALMLGLALALTYLRTPAHGTGPRALPWYDALAAAAALGAGLYVAIDYPNLVNELSYRPLDIVALGAVLLVLLLEGLRRTIGIPFTVVVVAFLAYALVGDLVPGKLAGRPIELTRLAVYMALDTNAMLGTPLIVGTTIVIPFIFLGSVLFRSGGSAFFTDISMALMGRYRGGPAKIAITASALFGSISGSAVSNVATTGVITIPLMREFGYPGRVAAAIEAVASTGGQLMPPIMGAAAFLMAEFLEIPYTDVVVAALVPALLYFLALFVQADLQAARAGLTRVEEEKIPALGRVLRSGWHYPLPFAVLVFALFGLNLAPETSALYATAVLAVTGLFFGYGGQRMRPLVLIESLRVTGLVVVDLVLICAGAGVVIGVLNLSGLGFGLTLSLIDVGAGNLPLLLVIAAAVSVVLGMGMPTVGVYVLLATLVAPALIEMGAEPIAAHLFVLYFGMMSMITPPVALAAFTAAAIAESEPMRTGLVAARFGWTAYLLPFLFVASSSLLLHGSTVDTVLAILTAAAGIWLATAALIGHLARDLALPTRVVLGAAGIALLIPAPALAFGSWLNGIGAVAGGLLVFWELAGVRRARAH